MLFLRIFILFYINYSVFKNTSDSLKQKTRTGYKRRVFQVLKLLNFKK